LSGIPALLLLVVLLLPLRAEALDLWRSDDGMRGLELTPSLKLFFFGVGGTLDGPEGYDELWPIPEVGGGTLGRVRLRLVGDITPRIRAFVHYEHRPRVLSSGWLLSSVSSSLQGDEEIPFRLHPMVWELAASDAPAGAAEDLFGPESSTFVWEHELDRLAMSFSLPVVDITVGRQAVGWGLGRLWAPLDLFAPMSPTDLDREERRGVDALRLTLNLTASSYFEVVAVGGSEVDDDGEREVTWGASALAWLLRVERWGVDFLLTAGKVGRDRVIGAGLSGQLFGVTLRGEVTGTEDEEGDRWTRATVGVEFGTPFNLTGIVEYHYNGFGTLEPESYLGRAARFASRLSTGQLSGLGQHYAGVTLAWQPGAWGGLTLIYVQNLTDGSLMLGPAVEYVLSDEVRLTAVALIPIGARPRWLTEGPIPEMEAQSEYGLGAQMYVLQIRASI
jgi:hypothetical protein